MWIQQLIYEDKHDRSYAHFATYEDAAAQMLEIITPRIPAVITDKAKSVELQELIDAESWVEVMELWIEETGEYINIEAYEVLGSEEAAERRNVYAVLCHMTNAVLDENVTGIDLRWTLGEKIVSKIISTPQLSTEFITFQLSIPGVEPVDGMEYSDHEPEEEEPEEEPEEAPEPKKRYPRV